MRGSDRPDYIRCYRELDLTTESEWEQARRQFKRLSQKWHPDRHQCNLDARAHAETKQRAINQAMRAIAEYHKMHGCMPLRPRTRFKPRQLNVNASGNIPEEELPETDSVLQKKRAYSGIWLWFMLMVLAVPAICVLLPEAVELSVVGQISNSYTQAGSDITVERDSSQIVLPGASDARTPLSATSASTETIHIGSSPDDVIRIQGEPLFRNGPRWDYGPSYIEFRYNRVSGWHNSPMRPLRVEE